jgi:DNA-binding LytR/AlgR family response regulator
VAAFEQGAVDYVLKPFVTARLAVAITRVRDRMSSAPADLEGLLRTLAGRAEPAKRYLRWITLAQGRTVQLITIDDISYFQADNKYTVAVTASAQSLINKTIRELLDELDPDVFRQIHRGIVVNINAIAAVHRDLRGRFEVQLKQRKERLPVSASFAHVFKRM